MPDRRHVRRGARPVHHHGHDGVVRDGYVVNDETIDVLRQQAVVQAEAGCDIIAPSDMMDGRVGAVAHGARRGRVRPCAHHVLRGEIRLGVLRAVSRRGRLGTTLGSADKRTYQMDPANGDEALREVALDLARGRRHGHGQAGDAVSRRRAPGEGGVPGADLSPTR